MSAIDDACDVMEQAARRIRQLEQMNSELLRAFELCVDNFNFARLVMDPQSRALAGQLVEDHRALISRAKEVA
jgi:hypothetical protein